MKYNNNPLTPKVFLGPMTKNVVDAAIGLPYPVAFIPSRRQIDCNSGYVNGWNTKTFANYVTGISPNALLERDHGGPNQGSDPSDDGLGSLIIDSRYLDIIHIDPWKSHKDIESGIKKTIELINHCNSRSSRIKFEVGTEEAIRKFTSEELTYLLVELRKALPERLFRRIEFVVVQSGVGLDIVNQKNTGVFDPARLRSMVGIAKDFGIKTKEHNGDYISAEEIHTRFDLGLDAINIAPEFGQYETQALIDIGDAVLHEQMISKCKSNETMFSKWFENNSINDDELLADIT